MRSHYCGLVTEALMGQNVTLCGWVNRRRDHGGVIFVDLRDREGYVQVVCDPDRAEMFKAAEGIRNEFCIQIKGLVRARPEGTTNDKLKSGQIEVLCHELTVLNASVTPPFQLDEENLSETTRLTHRVLDLRRPYMQNNLMLRYRVAMEVRKFLDANGFIDIETPMLTKSTPEGARDYLVPSRVHDGQFFALPQSPQLFKQLLMVAGYDRYYQITKCFRDEDLRADRQPEFTQIDIETSFLTEEDIREMFQGMITSVFKNTIGVDLGEFPVMTYQDAMRLYGSDKPDLRVNLQFTELTDVMKDVDFKVFSGAANMKGGRVVALRVPGGSVEGGGISRGEIDAYTEFVKIYGAKGLAYIRVNDAAKGPDLEGPSRWPGLQSPIVKNIHDAALQAVLERTGAQDGDLIFFGADKEKNRQRRHRRLAHQGGPQRVWQEKRFVHRGLAPDVGGGLPHVRVRRRERPLHRGAPPLHRAQRRPRGLDGHGPREVHFARLRHGLERLGNGRRLGAYPPRRCAAKSVRCPEDHPRRSANEIWLLARRAAVRRAPARWFGFWSGPHRDLDDRRRVDPRRDCFPQNSARAVLAHPSAQPGGREAAARIAHSPAQPRRGQNRLKPASGQGRCSHAPRGPWAVAQSKDASGVLFCASLLGLCGQRRWRGDQPETVPCLMF